MKKKKTLFSILFTILMIMLPLAAYASSAGGWFETAPNTGHTIAVANFADVYSTSDKEIYISLKERDASGNHIEMEEIRFSDHGDPFGKFVIDKLAASESAEDRMNGFVLSVSLFEDKECTKEITTDDNRPTSLNKGISLGGTQKENNSFKIDKELFASKLTRKVGGTTQPLRGEAYLKFKAEKLLRYDDLSNTDEETQELTLTVPIVVADRVIDEYEDFQAIKEYAYTAIYSASGYNPATYNGYQEYYMGYYVMSQDVDCGGQHTGIGYNSGGARGRIINSMFDGRGHALINTDIRQSAGGLFANMVSSTVKNLTVLNAKVTSDGAVIASIVGAKNTNVVAQKTIDAIANYNLRIENENVVDDSLIENVYVYGSLPNVANNYTPKSLLVGKTEAGIIRNCIAVMDNHELGAGVVYTQQGNNVPTTSGTTTDKVGAGILCAYVTSVATVQDCLAINLNVGSYEEAWVPAINDKYGNNNVSSRLRYPNTAEGLEDRDLEGLEDRDLEGYGGWYEHKPADVGIVDANLATANKFDKVNRVFTIEGWETYAKWWNALEKAGRFEENADCYSLYEFIKSSGVEWKANVNLDNASENHNQKANEVVCTIPVTPNQTAQNYFKQNVEVKKTVAVSGVDEKEINDVLNGDKAIVKDGSDIYIIDPGFSIPYGNNANIVYADIDDGQYHDYYTLYTVEGYIRMDNWIRTNADGSRVTLSNSNSIAISEFYGNYLKNKDFVDGSGEKTEKQTSVYNRWMYYSYHPYVSINGKKLTYKYVCRGAKAVITAKSLLDLNATQDEEDAVSIHLVDNCLKIGTAVTLDGNFDIDAQDDTVIEIVGSTSYLKNYVEIDIFENYSYPAGYRDTEYHGGIDVWRFDMDELTVMGVQYLADLENATTANLKNAPYLDFEWQDGRLVVYDKIQERIKRYGNEGEILFNTNNAGQHYLLLTAKHSVAGLVNPEYEGITESIVYIKIPITIWTKIFTTSEQLEKFYDYALMDDYKNRDNGKENQAVEAQLLAYKGQVSGVTWDPNTATDVPNSLLTGETVSINTERLLYKSNYDGLFTLGNDIDMGTATGVNEKTIESYWGWGNTVWCMNDYYIYYVGDTWYASPTFVMEGETRRNVEGWGLHDADLSVDGVQNGWADNGEYGFTGTFDGRGYILYNAKTTGAQGWFGNIGSTGTVKNLTLVKARLADGYVANLLAQRQSGKYENIYVHLDTVGVGSTSNSVAVLAGGYRSESATTKNVYIHVDHDSQADKINSALRKPATAYSEGKWSDAYVSIAGYTGNYNNMQGVLISNSGILPFSTNPDLETSKYIFDDEVLVMATAPRRTDGDKIAGEDSTSESLKSVLGDKFGTYFAVDPNDQNYWDQTFWTLDSDGLPIPIRLNNLTSDQGVKFRDISIGETSPIDYLDEYVKNNADSYVIEGVTHDTLDVEGLTYGVGANGVGKDIRIDKIDGKWSIVLTGETVNGKTKIPDGTKINVAIKISSDQTAKIQFTAKSITVINAADILIDKKSSNYVLNLSNIPTVDGSTGSVSGALEVRGLIIGETRCATTDFTFNKGNNTITINRSAYQDYKHEFVCTIQNGTLTRIFGNIYFYDMLIKDADDLDQFIPTAQKKLGGPQFKTWTGTYLLANDIVYNEDPYAKNAREYGVKFTGEGDTRNSQGAYGFGGVFDGRGYTIDGLIISSAKGSFVGQLAEPGLVCNTNFINTRLTASGAALISSGVASAGTIQDCYMHVFAEASGQTNPIIIDRNYAESRIKRCIVDLAVNDNTGGILNVQSSYNVDYGGYDEVYVIGKNVRMTYAYGSSNGELDEIAIYNTFDDFVAGICTYCSDGYSNSALEGHNHKPVMTEWATLSGGFWTEVEYEEGKIPVSAKFLEWYNTRTVNADFIPPSTLIQDGTNKKLNIQSDCYASLSIEQENGATINNHYVNVPNGAKSFKIVVKSYLRPTDSYHPVFVSETLAVDMSINNVYMNKGSDDIVIKLHDTVYKTEYGVDEHDIVKLQDHDIRIESNFHDQRALYNYDYHETGYTEPGSSYEYDKVLILNKNKLAGVTYGEVKLYLTYHVFTSDATFDENGVLSTGEIKKALNVVVSFNLITAEIGTTAEFNKFWDYALDSRNVETVAGQVVSYGGYFVLTNNIVTDRTWDNRWFWSEEIKAYWNFDYGFKGIVDGQGYVIEGISFDKKEGTKVDTMGLFGVTNHKTEIRNIGFVNVSIDQGQSLIAAQGGGSFENIYVQVKEIAGKGSSDTGNAVFIAKPNDPTTLSYNKIFVELSQPPTAHTPDNYTAVLGAVKTSGISNTIIINRGMNDYICLDENDPINNVNATTFSAKPANNSVSFTTRDNAGNAGLSADIANAFKDSVWHENTVDNLPVFKQLAFNGESLDIGVVLPGASYTLALSNPVISRMSTWTLAGQIAGVSIENGKLVVADTVQEGTEITILATTIYGHKDFKITVA